MLRILGFPVSPDLYNSFGTLLMYFHDLMNNAAINFCHNHPPGTHGDLHRKFALLCGFCILNFARGGGDFFGVGPEGRAFVYKRFLPFLEFSLLSQELATDNTLAFNICCYVIL